VIERAARRGYPVIALIGPHGAGKTTLGLALAKALGLPFHDELGREMAGDPSWRAPGRTAEHAQQGFDAELFARERARDLTCAGPRIVETWHPGNLAYAARRSPEVAAAWLPDLRRVVPGTLALPIIASRRTLAARQSEPGDLHFFLEIGLASLRWAADLGAVLLPPVHTDRTSAPILARRVAARLHREFPCV
jgi:DNA polymerase III delta prime subunit